MVLDYLIKIITIYLTFLTGIHNAPEPGAAHSTDCGIVPNIPKHSNSKYSHFPWNVAVFEVNEEERFHICGGTIISQHLIISAAHCFYDEAGGVIDDPSNYEIMVAKITKDYNVQDSADTRAYKLRAIYSDNFEGGDNKFAHDIVIIETSEKIHFKPTVAPACMEWSRKNHVTIRHGATGKGVSWGISSSSESRIVDLISSNHESCHNDIPDTFQSYITSDKFCIENITDESIQTSDAGGGFFILSHSRYQLVGVLSIQLESENFVKYKGLRSLACNSHTLTVTNVSQHMIWIRKEQSNLEHRADSTGSRSSNGGNCHLPVLTAALKYNVHCPHSEDIEYVCPSHPGVLVPQFTNLEMQCENGFTYDHEDTSPVCFNGVWKPMLANCTSVCKKLKPSNVKLTCVYGEKEISCESTMRAGTIVYPECLPAHKPQGGNPDYREIVCQEDGEWDETLFKCSPECGLPYKKTETLIQGGRNETYGDSPWHVAIYDITSGSPSTYPLICGGTIITPHLIISAAHCFTGLDGTKRNATDYEIVVSKVKRDYTIKDNVDTQAYKIKTIHFSSKGYYGLITKHLHDIAILETEHKLILKPTVLAACVQWTRWNRFTVPEGTPGKIVGWGIDDSNNSRGSETLLAVDLPFVSYEKCVEISSTTFTQFVTADKFCAGDSKGGPTAAAGDSGGGLMFIIDSLYYLSGIVSVKEEGTSLTAFTDISEHLQWIDHVKNEVERRIIRTESHVPLKHHG